MSKSIPSCTEETKKGSESIPSGKEETNELVSNSIPSCKEETKGDENEIDISTLMAQLKDNGKKKKSGGFQSMGLSKPILKAILKKGYKVPTPIQRKVIPVVMQRKNVIAMARTGSGKTAAFLVPMLDYLKSRNGTTVRALIFSPTRELAMQTMKFTQELAVFTNLKAVLISGGEKIDNHFAALTAKPDIVITTPGRFLHVIIEMHFRLFGVRYVVFDEADRLFEMGFQDQILEILHRLPSRKQTLLFSATLPKDVVEFVKAGIEDPVLIRLDVDHQISKDLKSSVLLCRTDDKLPVLLHLLRNVVNLKKELTVVFLATRHHIEYVKDVLEKANIPCSYIYSSLDQMARNIHLGKFKANKVGVLLVTDIAARGLDIPLLDNVINYNFPAKPKLYVHRVGRVARAGRCGCAYSLISPDEVPYLLDLHLFLGKPLKLAKADTENEDDVCGSVPQSLIDDENEVLQPWHQLSVDLTSMLKVTKNSYKQYVASRPKPSNESVLRSKQLSFSQVEVHPIFKDRVEAKRDKFLNSIKSYRPNTTIFEFGNLAKNYAQVMRAKRKSHDVLIKSKNAPDSSMNEFQKEVKSSSLENASENDLKDLEQKSKNILSKKAARAQKSENFKDTENYLPHIPSAYYKEKGLGLESNLSHQLSNAMLDFTGDDNDTLQKNSIHWDRKRKRFTKEDNNKRANMMQTKSGIWLPKSYRSDLYKKWKWRNQTDYQDDNENEEGQFGKQKGVENYLNEKRKEMKEKASGSRKKRKSEMKRSEQILKTRKWKERFAERMKNKHSYKASRKQKARR